MKDFDFEADLAIDPDALDIEWLNHSQVFMRYAEEYAEAQRRLDKAHENVKVVRSRVVKRIKEQQGGTQQEVEAAYRMSSAHRKAKQEMIDAEFEANLLRSAVSAFHARKTALESLVRLHGQSYFSGPQEPRNLGLEFDKKAKEGRRKRGEQRIKKKTSGRS